MRRYRWKEQGFTLIELVIVIAIIGILAAIAIPRFIDIRKEAYISQRDGMAGVVRAGILTVAAKNHVDLAPKAQPFPPNLEAAWDGSTGGTLELDGTVCTTKACFELVIPGGVLDANWTQTTDTTYDFATTAATGVNKTYTYDTTNGSFQY